ncbi:MAG: polyhydroxyalkanoate synthesis repressor PhaR [Rhodospirillaceae bacterium]|nr:polyhydroxyalkanoate synthesis repressor PhaR [Rhodospirillaceae bacterium]
MTGAEGSEKAAEGKTSSAPITIKKYANRRLYNTATSSYVTLDYLCQLVKDGVEFVVYDAKTGEDITRSVLTQIIVEEEAKGHNLLPINFLRQLISLYGDSLQFLVPRYLEQSMEAFARNQEQIRRTMQEAFGGMFPFGATWEEMGKTNAALFERAMQMFAPFRSPEPARPPAAAPAAPPADAGEADVSVEELKRQLDVLQKKVEGLSGAKGGDGGKAEKA